MSVGYIVNKGAVDNQVGNAVVQLRDAMDRIETIKAAMDSILDAELLAAPFAYTQAEVDLLRSSLSDLSALVATARGQRTQPEASDFFFFARRLTGLS